MIRNIPRRTLLGILAALATAGLLTAAMLPFRSNISIATAGLVLVVPVVVGVVTGGFIAGIVSVAIGFLIYFFFFIPPYLTTAAGATENWTALGVYVLVLIPVARVVDNMVRARAQANERGLRLRQLFEISGLLVEDKPVQELLSTIVSTLRDAVDARQVSILLPHRDRLGIVATAGAPLTVRDQDFLEQLSIETDNVSINNWFVLALRAAGRPVGLLAISAAALNEQQRESLQLFASQAALAIERAQLREETVRAERRLERGLLSVPLIADDSPLTVVSRYLPGREHAQLSGDFFDVIRTPDGRVWVMIGDVAGHGPDEAVIGVYLRVGWRALVLGGHAPQYVLPALQDLLENERHHEETFATVCMFVIDEHASRATVFLAGHPAPLLLCGARIHEMDVESEPPLGIAAGIHWTGQTVELGKAWSMLCYTDGLTEGFDDGPTRLGADGLIALLASRDPDEDVDYLVDTLIKDVVARNGGALADDVAILHLSRRSRGR